MVTNRHATEAVRKWFAAGADEVITPLFEPGEQAGRLDALVTRAERDVAVNPSTRLPGTTEIEREIKRRMELGEFFAVCYADLDHFKEYSSTRSSRISTTSRTAGRATISGRTGGASCTGCR